MLAHLRDLGTGWTGQVLFSDGSGFQDPHVLYGWFDANADEALRAIESGTDQRRGNVLGPLAPVIQPVA